MPVASSVKSPRSSSRKRQPLNQLVLVMRSSLLSETLAAMLERRFTSASLLVNVVRNLSEPLDAGRSRGSCRVVLTDRLDDVSQRVIAASLPCDCLVTLGELEDTGSPNGRRHIALPSDPDVDTVFSELFPLYPLPTQPVAKSRPVGKRLSPRENEVLRQIALGATVREIAADLQLATRTVENQKYRMMDKLQIRNTAELTRYAIRIGLIEP